MLAAVFNVTASVYSQSVRVDLDLKDASLEKVFQSIQDQTEFDFFYKNEYLPSDKTISKTYNECQNRRGFG
jgi:TonB-dependent starch-binding outer membrane protein SusC